MHAVEKRRESERPKAKETNSVFSAPCAKQMLLPLLIIMGTDCGIIIIMLIVFFKTPDAHLSRTLRTVPGSTARQRLEQWQN